MRKPRRIQRKRTRGWRMPRNCRYIGRGSVFGNPFDWQTHGKQGAKTMYRLMLDGRWAELRRRCPQLTWWADTMLALQCVRGAILHCLPELRGKDVCCWCAEDEPHCHGDILLELANA